MRLKILKSHPTRGAWQVWMYLPRPGLVGFAAHSLTPFESFDAALKFVRKALALNRPYPWDIGSSF